MTRNEIETMVAGSALEAQIRDAFGRVLLTGTGPVRERICTLRNSKGMTAKFDLDAIRVLEGWSFFVRLDGQRALSAREIKSLLPHLADCAIVTEVAKNEID